MHFKYLNEIWKDIKGYEGLYQISNFGRVKSLNKILYCGNGRYRITRAKLLNPVLFKKYYKVGLYKNKKMKLLFIHRLVAEAFIPNPHKYSQVNHKDENKLNNNVLNLEWVDAKTNANYGTRNIRISKSLTNGETSKPILQYDLEDNYIKEWPSSREIERQTGFFHNSINNCCKGTNLTAYGYIWKYKDDS